MEIQKKMHIFHRAEEVRAYLREQRKKGRTIGFVPTMGYLHEGHLSLFRQAARQTDCAIASIFVNPTQFGDQEDYLKYPKDPAHDRFLASGAGIEGLFCPDQTVIYPNGTTISVTISEKTDVLCGKSRPGHFDGVGTVLTKLFNIIQPDKVFFGMKDAQQIAIVKDLIDAFHFPVKMIACPIVREPDGLARSSRNVRLSAAERQEAVHLYKSLQAGLELVRDGNRSFSAIKERVRAYLKSHLSLGTVDYVDVLHYPELKRSKDDQIQGRFIIALAVNYTYARLIDNVTGICSGSCDKFR